MLSRAPSQEAVRVKLRGKLLPGLAFTLLPRLHSSFCYRSPRTRNSNGELQTSPTCKDMPDSLNGKTIKMIPLGAQQAGEMWAEGAHTECVVGGSWKGRPTWAGLLKTFLRLGTQHSGPQVVVRFSGGL